MENQADFWSKEDLSVYLLLYAAKVDLEITSDEEELIVTKYGQKAYDNMFQQIKMHNDFDSIEKIKQCIENLELSENEVSETLNEARTVFEADGKFDAIERGVFNVLKKIFAN